MTGTWQKNQEMGIESQCSLVGVIATSQVGVIMDFV